MTHGSYINNKFTEDYQKLAFLGDFLLNFLISRHLEWKNRDSSISLGKLTQRRSKLISNRVLAWLVVKNKFHTHPRVSCPYAKIEIDRFVSLIKKIDVQLNISHIEGQRRRTKQFCRCISRYS